VYKCISVFFVSGEGNMRGDTWMIEKENMRIRMSVIENGEKVLYFFHRYYEFIREIYSF
jgi:hypothetical protein